MRSLRAIPRLSATESLTQRLEGSWRAYSMEELAAMRSMHAARRAVEAGEIVKLLPNAYVARAHSESFHARADALLSWVGPGGLISGVSALFLWGLVDEPPERVEVSVAHRQRIGNAPGWARLRRVTYSLASARTGKWNTVSPAMALAQGFGDLMRSERVGVVFRAQQMGHVSTEDVERALASMPRVSGRRQLVSCLRQIRMGAESFLEAHAMDEVFDEPDFDCFVRQHVVTTRNRRYRLDMYDQETRTAVEIDGAAVHSDPSQWQLDIERGVELAAIGILTVRFSYRDLMNRPEWCKDKVRAALRSRRVQSR